MSRLEQGMYVHQTPWFMQVSSISEAGFVPGCWDIKLIWLPASRKQSLTTPGFLITRQHTPGMLTPSDLAVGAQLSAISLPESHFLGITVLRKGPVPDS